MEIDWSKAPQWATHHNYDCFCPWLRDGERSVYFYRGEWVEYANPDVGRAHINGVYSVPRPADAPAAPAWTGAGLPPVGTVCEASNGGDSAFFKCEVVAVHYKTGRPILKTNGPGGPSALTLAPECWKFRPIRTPEQIAAEEREKAIDEIAKILDGLWSSEREAAGFLYDAGYRKQA